MKKHLTLLLALALALILCACGAKTEKTETTTMPGDATYHNGVAAVPAYLLVPDVITADNVAEYMDADADLAG